MAWSSYSGRYISGNKEKKALDEIEILGVAFWSALCVPFFIGSQNLVGTFLLGKNNLFGGQEPDLGAEPESWAKVLYEKTRVALANVILIIAIFYVIKKCVRSAGNIQNKHPYMFIIMKYAEIWKFFLIQHKFYHKFHHSFSW